MLHLYISQILTDFYNCCTIFVANKMLHASIAKLPILS